MSERKEFTIEIDLGRAPDARARRVYHPPHRAGRQGGTPSAGDDLSRGVSCASRWPSSFCSSCWWCVSLLWNAPLEELADPLAHSQSGESAVVLSGLAGTAALFPSRRGGGIDSGVRDRGTDRHPLRQCQCPDGWTLGSVCGPTPSLDPLRPLCFLLTAFQAYPPLLRH